MGKVAEKVKLTSLCDSAETLEIEAVIDTGATMLVIPQDIVGKMGLRR
jgi:predicted aspartyl protease